MAGSASTVKVTFLGDAAGLARAAQAAQGQIDKVAESVGKASRMGAFLGTAAGGLVGGALDKVKEFAKGAVDAYAAVEDATGAAGVEFGAQLPQVTAFADQAATSFGISKRAALEAQNTFGTFGKAAGLTGTDLSGFSQKLTGLAGDLASFKGTSTEQAIDAVGSALRGEMEPIRAYGVLMDQASLQAEAMSLGLLKATKNTGLISEAHKRAQLAQETYNKAVKDHGKDSAEATRAQISLGSATRALDKATQGSVGPLTNQQKVLAAQSLILKQTTDAQGDYARTSSSTANVQKTLAAETENAQAKLGKQLAPALTAVRQVMLRAIQSASGLATGISALAGFVERNRGAFAVFAAVVGAVVLPAMARMVTQWIVTGVQATISAAKQAAAWLMQQGAAYRAVAAMAVSFAVTIANWVRAGAVAMAQAARMAAAWLISIGPIAIAIAAVVGAVVLIVKNWDTIKRATAAAWDFVKSMVKKAIDAVVFILKNFTGPGLIISHFNLIVDTVKAVPGKLRDAVSAFLQVGLDLIQGIIDGVVQKARDIPGVIKDKVVDGIKGAIKGGLGIFSPSRVTREYGQNVAEGMAVGISDKAKQVTERVQSMVDKAKQKLADIKSFAGDIRKAFVDGGNITGIDTSLQDAAGKTVDGGFGALLAGLQKRAADASAFASAMAQLRSGGLNKTTLDQLRDAGPEGGLSAAQNLLAGGAAGIGQVNALTGQIAATGSAFAAREAKAKFGISSDETLRSLSNREIRVVLDLRGDDEDLLRRLRKRIRAEGGNVQTVLGKA